MSDPFLSLHVFSIGLCNAVGIVMSLGGHHVSINVNQTLCMLGE